MWVMGIEVQRKETGGKDYASSQLLVMSASNVQ